jgi:anion-transporting  ArsA/GET3 family ATPase
VIERYARDAEQADRILANRFYQRLSSTLAGTQEYMAMEKLYELHESQRYDLLVVDTPPTRSALDFLDAPDNLNELLDARAFRLLIAPAQRIGRSYLRGLNLATTAMSRMVRRVTGSELLAEVGEFFAAFEGMYDGVQGAGRAGLRPAQAPEHGVRGGGHAGRGGAARGRLLRRAPGRRPDAARRPGR